MTMINKTCLSLLLVLVTINPLFIQSAKAQQPAIVPFDRERVLAGQAVIIRDGRIAQIDGRGKYLMPVRKMLENVATLNRQNVEGTTAKANFAGTWALDKANSEGLPPGMDQLMTVVHTGDKLSLETKLITEQGEQVVPDSYVLDGKEVEFTPRTPGGQAGKGKRIAKWTADGNGIEVSETATFDTPEGPVNIQATRKWTLSPDGKTLKIEMTVDGPNGKQVLKRTFVRK